jgi:hypothetical protein
MKKNLKTITRKPVTIEKCLELIASQANNNTGDNAEEDKPKSDPEEMTNTTKKTPTTHGHSHSDPLILEPSIKSFAWENGFVIVRKRTVLGMSITF